jgi:hypothetical protein
MAKRKSTKGQTTIYKTKDRVTRTPLKTGGELRWSTQEGYTIVLGINNKKKYKRTNNDLLNIRIKLKME